MRNRGAVGDRSKSCGLDIEVPIQVLEEDWLLSQLQNPTQVFPPGSNMRRVPLGSSLTKLVENG